MDSIPIVFVAFKLLAFGTVAAVFLSFLLGLGLFTFTLCRMVGLDLTFP